MPYYYIVLISLAIIYFLAVLVYMFGKKNAIRFFLLDSLAGVLLLTVLKLCEKYLMITVNINIISVLSSAVLGVPGLGLYFLIDFLFL